MSITPFVKWAGGKRQIKGSAHSFCALFTLYQYCCTHINERKAIGQTVVFLFFLLFKFYLRFAL